MRLHKIISPGIFPMAVLLATSFFSMPGRASDGAGINKAVEQFIGFGEK